MPTRPTVRRLAVAVGLVVLAFAPLAVVLVGGGAAGVELALALAHMAGGVCVEP